MRLSTLLLLALGVAALAAVGGIVHWATRDMREWKELLALEGKDLYLDNGETSMRAAKQFRDRVPRRHATTANPLVVRTLDGPNGDKRVLLVELVEDTTPIHVGQLAVSVFDGNRRLLSQSDLFAGFKVDHFLIQATTKGNLGGWSFEIEAEKGTFDPGCEHEIFVLRNELPVLVRVEDHSGTIDRVEYERVPNRIGEVLPERSPEDWERSLSSPDLAEILRTLIWLGGHHADPGDPPSKYGEAEAASQLFVDTKARPGIRSKLAELAKHPHPWVAEAARAIRD